MQHAPVQHAPVMPVHARAAAVPRMHGRARVDERTRLPFRAFSSKTKRSPSLAYAKDKATRDRCNGQRATRNRGRSNGLTPRARATHGGAVRNTFVRRVKAKFIKINIQNRKHVTQDRQWHHVFATTRTTRQDNPAAQQHTVRGCARTCTHARAHTYAPQPLTIVVRV